MPQTMVGDLNVHYEVKGSGYPLLMIMGLSFSLLDWEGELLDELVKHYQVILFDNRDAGQTTSSSVKNYTIADMADDTGGLLKALGIGQAHVFGASMGGMVAQQFALRHADKLNKLVLCCTMAGGSCSLPVGPDLIDRSLLDLLFTPSYLTDSDNKKKAQNFFAKTSPFHSKEGGLLRQRQAHTSHDMCSRLQDIKAHTLVITGDNDIVILPANSNVLVERIPGSKLEIIKDAGHGFLFSHAPEVAKLVIDFLQ